MKLTASQLRENIYKILDTIVDTGTPVEIERNGHILQIISVKRSYSKLSKLTRRKVTDEDSDYFTHIDWSHEWKEREEESSTEKNKAKSKGKSKNKSNRKGDKK
ncbi:MAG: hypothetical protein HQK50_11440 [Oligoflexia bacterium]|nr:hypothetical protein [Oligoflexia bacterium]